MASDGIRTHSVTKFHENQSVSSTA